MNIPASYEYINAVNSQVNPSSIHVSNTALTRFFRRYLLQKVISVFEFDGIPDTWDLNYFQYILFICGFIGIIETKEFGVIPQFCTLQGRNVFWQPTHIVVSNQYLRGITNPKIDSQCTVIKMQPDWGGCYDLVCFYADMLALCAESAGLNLVNSKLAYVFTATDKSSAESFKKLYDKVASGEPCVVQDKNLLREDGNLNWQYFAQNLSQNYIAGAILDDLKKWDDMFNTQIGIPNANTYKKERLIVDEVNANNIDTRAKVMLWKETMENGIEKTNEMFGLNLSVKYKYDVPVEEFTGQTGDEDRREMGMDF